MIPKTLSYQKTPKERETHRNQAKTRKLGCWVSFALLQRFLLTNFALNSPWLCLISAPSSLRPTLSSTATCKPLFSKYCCRRELRFHIVMVLPSNLITNITLDLLFMWKLTLESSFCLWTMLQWTMYTELWRHRKPIYQNATMCVGINQNYSFLMTVTKLCSLSALVLC